MKKITLVLGALLAVGALLSGCYSKSCEQAPTAAPAKSAMSLKGEG